MKKQILTGMLAATLVLALSTASAFAAVPMGAGYIDANGDGICDNFASGSYGNGYGRGVGRRGSGCLGHIADDGTWVRCVDADGDGVCDTCGAAVRVGAGYIDADGDGVCDNFASGSCGNGYGHGHITNDGTWVRCADTDGDGVCDTCGAAIRVSPRFVDADGDGVCDNFTSGTREGRYGGGMGRHGGCGR